MPSHRSSCRLQHSCQRTLYPAPAKLPGASQRGLMESFKVSSVDPTCLCSVLVIVPLFKITFLAFSDTKSHHILVFWLHSICKKMANVLKTRKIARFGIKSEQSWRAGEAINISDPSVWLGHIAHFSFIYLNTSLHVSCFACILFLIFFHVCCWIHPQNYVNKVGSNPTKSAHSNIYRSNSFHMDPHFSVDVHVCVLITVKIIHSWCRHLFNKSCWGKRVILMFPHTCSHSCLLSLWVADGKKIKQTGITRCIMGTTNNWLTIGEPLCLFIMVKPYMIYMSFSGSCWNNLYFCLNLSHIIHSVEFFYAWIVFAMDVEYFPLCDGSTG